MSMALDTSGFDRAVQALTQKSGASVAKALESETSRVLGQCVKRTAVAKAVKKLGSGFARQGQSELWVNTTGKGGSPIGRAWLVEPGAVKGKTCYIVRGPGDLRKWSNKRWALMQTLLARAEGGKEAKKAHRVKGRGLAKASWVQSAAALGLTVSPQPPGYVATAIPQDGIRRTSGKGRRVESQDETGIEIENLYPLLTGGAKKGAPSLDGLSILQGALATREAYVIRALEAGWLDDAKTIAQRFPGLTVS